MFSSRRISLGSHAHEVPIRHGCLAPSFENLGGSFHRERIGSDDRRRAVVSRPFCRSYGWMVVRRGAMARHVDTLCHRGGAARPNQLVSDWGSGCPRHAGAWAATRPRHSSRRGLLALRLEPSRSYLVLRACTISRCRRNRRPARGIDLVVRCRDRNVARCRAAPVWSGCRNGRRPVDCACADGGRFFHDPGSMESASCLRMAAGLPRSRARFDRPAQRPRTRSVPRRRACATPRWVRGDRRFGTGPCRCRNRAPQRHVGDRSSCAAWVEPG